MAVNENEETDLSLESASEEYQWEGEHTPESVEEAVAEDAQQQGSNAVPYARFREVNEQRKRDRAEVERLKAQVELLAQQTMGSYRPAKQEDDVPLEELAEKYEGKPVEFVREVARRTMGKDINEVKALKEKMRDYELQSQVAQARARYGDFGDYEQDIASLIEDKSLPIDPFGAGSIDLYYGIAKARRSSMNVSESAPGQKPPHVESAKKRARPKGKSFDEMDLTEMERALGFSKKEGY